MDKAKAGKIKFICISSIALLLQSSLFLTYILQVGTDRVVGQIIRFCITIFLVTETYYGSKFARLFLSAYLLINALGLIVLSERVRNNNSFISILIFILFIFYFSGGIYLKFSKDISHFVNSKRAFKEL